MKHLMNQLARFSIVGILAFLIDYGGMLLLTETFHIYYLISATISFLASVIFNYVMSVRFVFQTDKHGKHSGQLVVFTLLSAVGLGINHVVMLLLSERFLINYKLSKLVATAMVSVYNFISRKLFLERREGGN